MFLVVYKNGENLFDINGEGKDNYQLFIINMVKTRSGLSYQQQQNQPIQAAKSIKYKQHSSSTVKLFSYAFPKKNSPCYFNRQSLAPCLQEKYDQVQRQMNKVNTITFQVKQKKATFNWVKPQIHQVQTNSRQQNSISSHASTEIKVDYSQMRECMQEFNQQFGDFFNKAHSIHQSFQIVQECSYVSSCEQDDIEIQERIAQSQRKDNEMRPQYEQHQQTEPNQLNNQMFVQQVLPNIPVFPPQIENLAAFGPLNIDQLSTNQTLNPNSQSIQIQQININHIFIENVQNQFENLSEMSTKACMSHNDNSVNFNQAVINQERQEQFHLLLWNSQNNLPLYSHLTQEDINKRIQIYLRIILEFLSKQSNQNLNMEQREQFWSLMTIIGINIDPENIDIMNKFIEKCQEDQEKITNEYEYCLIKERVENMNLLSKMLIYNQ